eukprot:symbB.v1.2.033515.t1/scaffold4164.1/size43661/3
MLSPNAKTVQIGRICQLNYGWGGLLEYSTISGSQQVPFSASTLPLRIGQEVGFYLQCEGNRIEAVNLQAPSSPPSSRSNDAKSSETKNRFQIAEASNGDVLSPTSASPILQRQIQRLQQRIAIFGNASQEEQCQMVLEAERALDILLDETDLDGDALCRLVRHCASWLRAPSLSAATKKPLDEETTAASQEIPGHLNLQQRVRKLLIRALSHLDLSDGPTFQALEAAFIYMQTLLQLLDWKARSHLSTKSTWQWLRLRALLSSSLKPMVGEPDQSQESLPPSYLPVANGPVVEARGDRSVRSGYLKCFAGSVYEPSQKIQALRTIFQSETVAVKCSECSFTISSSWRFQHPKRGTTALLVPSNGHSICQRNLKKRCYWTAMGRMRTKADVHANLNFCCHDRLLMQCAPCGGKMMCEHGRQRYQCKDCRGGRICEHDRRKDLCKICKHLPKQRNRRNATK